MRKSHPEALNLCEIYLKKLGGAWFCIGLMADGTLRFTSLSERDAKEALSRGIRTLKAWGKPKKAERIPREVEKIFRQMAEAYQGLGIRELPPLAWSELKPFTRKVLRLTLQIPRGRVTSYGLMAKVLGVPRAARAVGVALASNPYPLLIPCHRIVKGDLTLGGYGLGVKIKAEILRREGVSLEEAGKAVKVKPECYLSWERLKRQQPV